MPLSNYAENKFIDVFRGQNVTAPATWYFGKIVASRGTWTASTAYSTGDTVLPTTANGRMYRCTTAGNSAASEPTWPTTVAGTVADGTVVWTEASDFIDAGTFTEPSGGSYARVALTNNNTNFSSTVSSSDTTAVSTGTSGRTYSLAAITLNSPTSTEGLVFAVGRWDASTAGNLWEWGVLNQPRQQSNGDPAINIAIGAWQLALDT